MQKDKPNMFLSVSTVVFTNGVPNYLRWDLNMQICAENTLKIMVSAKIKTKKMTPNYPKIKVSICSKHRSISGPSMLLNVIGPDMYLRRRSILDIFRHF